MTATDQYVKLRNMVSQTLSQPETALQYAFGAGVHAWVNGVGELWADPILEDLLAKIGQRILSSTEWLDSGLSTPVDVLCIASTLCDVGGHSLMIVNWLQVLHDAGYSTAFLSTCINPMDEAPKHLKSLKALGPVEILPGDSPFTSRILQLSLKIKQYRPKLILLVINPQDVMVMAALSNLPHIPTLFLDHADHVWWLGKGISDRIVEYRQQGIDNALHQRGIDISRIVTVPLLCGYPTLTDGPTPINIRQLHHIPDNAPVSLTVATLYKILNARTWDYPQTIMEMLRKNRRLHHILILNAVPEDLKAGVPEDLRNRLHLTGPVSHDELEPYYSQVDFLIESWPFPGSTVRYEALSLGLPIVVVDSGDNPGEIELMGLPDYVEIDQKPSNFHATIQRMIRQSGSYRQQSLDFFQAHFHLEKVKAQMVACVKEVLK